MLDLIMVMIAIIITCIYNLVHICMEQIKAREMCGHTTVPCSAEIN
jgi:hypothetical protein